MGNVEHTSQHRDDDGAPDPLEGGQFRSCDQADALGPRMDNVTIGKGELAWQGSLCQ